MHGGHVLLLLLAGGGSGEAAAAAIGIREAFRAYAIAQAQLADVVGDRVRPQARPQADGLPCLTFAVISDRRGRDLDGPDGTATARVQVDFWSEDADVVAELARILEGLIDGFPGGDFGGLDVDWIWQDGEADQQDPTRDGADSRFFRASIDYHIRYRPQT